MKSNLFLEQFNENNFCHFPCLNEVVNGDVELTKCIDSQELLKVEFLNRFQELKLLEKDLLLIIDHF